MSTAADAAACRIDSSDRYIALAVRMPPRACVHKTDEQVLSRINDELRWGGDTAVRRLSICWMMSAICRRRCLELGYVLVPKDLFEVTGYQHSEPKTEVPYTRVSASCLNTVMRKWVDCDLWAILVCLFSYIRVQKFDAKCYACSNMLCKINVW